MTHPNGAEEQYVSTCTVKKHHSPVVARTGSRTALNRMNLASLRLDDFRHLDAACLEIGSATLRFPDSQ